LKSSQPPERPKPPDGYETWLDYILGGFPSIDGGIRDAARAELKELRAKAELVDLQHRTLDALDKRKGEDIEAWADQPAEDVCDATD
jgi:hypothetical protein